jgi:hypothetical protein
MKAAAQSARPAGRPARRTCVCRPLVVPDVEGQRAHACLLALDAVQTSLIGILLGMIQKTHPKLYPHFPILFPGLRPRTTYLRTCDDEARSPLLRVVIRLSSFTIPIYGRLRPGPSCHCTVVFLIRSHTSAGTICAYMRHARQAVFGGQMFMTTASRTRSRHADCGEMRGACMLVLCQCERDAAAAALPIS